MKRHLLALAIGLAALFGVSAAEAANLYLCAPSRAGAALGPASFTASSGTTYRTNSRGCTLVAYADVGDALALGYAVNAPFGSMTRTLISASSATATFTLPASAYIQQIIVAETSGASITGGIMIGSTSGGNDIIKAISANSGQISANVDSAALTAVSPTSVTSADWTLRRRAFSKTLQQNIWVDSPNSFNGGAVDVTIVYGFF